MGYVNILAVEKLVSLTFDSLRLTRIRDLIRIYITIHIHSSIHVSSLANLCYAKQRWPGDREHISSEVLSALKEPTY